MSSGIDIVRANFSRRTDIQGELRQIDEAAVTDQRAYTEQEEARVAELRTELESIDSRISANLQMEARSESIDDGMSHLLGVLANRDTGETEDTRSIGERVVQDDNFRGWLGGGAHGQSPVVDLPGMDFRAVTNVTTASGSGGSLTRPERLSRIGQDFLDRRLFLIDLLPHINTNQGAVEYVQDQTPLADMANKAVEVTENTGAKPQAGPTFAVVTEAMATIAAWANLTRQAAADVPQVQSYLDNRLRYSLKRRTDLQCISGNGTAPNLKGLANRTGILTNAPGSAEARYITVRHSITLMENVESVPEIIVVNPADSEIFDLTNATSAGIHATPDATGGLQQAPGRTMWGLRTVHSTAIASGTALLIDPTAIAVVDRQAATAYMTDSHASQFINNILTLLLELRVGLALFNPAGVLLATFNGTA